MPLSPYHQQYANQSDEEIAEKAQEKLTELEEILGQVAFTSTSDPVKIAVLGCGDKRLVEHHRRIFAEVLKKDVEINTFDITIDHLKGEENVFQHDCTLPLPNSPYDIVFSHVLLKFIPTDKQYDLLKNSYNVLSPGGLAIHVIDADDIGVHPDEAEEGMNIVPLDLWKGMLADKQIEHIEVLVKYGVAFILKK